MGDDRKDYRKGPDGRVIVRIEKRPEEGGRGQGSRAPTAESARGFQDPARLAHDLFIPPDEDGVRVYDLGTRLDPVVPYSYEELDFHWPVSYNLTGLENPPANHFVSVPLSVPSNLWAEYEARTLAGQPFDYTTVSGRKHPNVLPLNYEAPYGGGLVDFYSGVEGPFPLYNLTPESDWRWAAAPLVSSGWSPDVTSQELAPQAGQFLQREKHNYTDFYLWDGRYRDFRYKVTPQQKVTTFPVFSAPGVTLPPTITYPLRIFGAPSVVRPVMEVGCTAYQSGQPSPPSGDEAFFALAVCTVQEIYVPYTSRIPQIPVPGIGAYLDWYASFPEGKKGLTLKRVTRRATGVLNYYNTSNMPPTTNVPNTTTWEIFGGRWPREYAEIEQEAGIQAREDVLNIGPQATQHFPRLIGPGYVTLNRPAGRFVGAVEVGKRVYYLWRAVL